MKLKGLDGQAVELQVVGYQFTSSQSDNWLVIKIHVVHPLGSWSAVDSSLQTYEVEELAQWFENIVMGMETKTYLGFLENNLQLELVGEGKNQVLRIYFELDLRPKWAASKYAYQDDLWIEIPLSELDLFAASQSLRDMLRNLPGRPRL